MLSEYYTSGYFNKRYNYISKKCCKVFLNFHGCISILILSSVAALHWMHAEIWTGIKGNTVREPWMLSVNAENSFIKLNYWQYQLKGFPSSGSHSHLTVLWTAFLSCCDLHILVWKYDMQGIVFFFFYPHPQIALWFTLWHAIQTFVSKLPIGAAYCAINR